MRRLLCIWLVAAIAVWCGGCGTNSNAVNPNQDDSDVTIYVDGSLDATDEQMVTPNANGEPLLIGTYRSINAFNESGHFDGIIDELQIYSVALSAKEIEALFDGLSIDDPMFFSNGSISSINCKVPST